MRHFLLLGFIAILFLVGVASADYTSNFTAVDIVHANQSIIQDPTHGNSVPWFLWILSGLIGLGLVVLALTRSKLQGADYETSIVVSVLAWPFCWYFAWGGITSVDYIVGISATSINNGGEAAFLTQHILYSFWVLGWVGVVGCIFAAFVTTLLVSQFKLFKENEENAKNEKRKQEM